MAIGPALKSYVLVFDVDAVDVAEFLRAAADIAQAVEVCATGFILCSVLEDDVKRLMRRFAPNGDGLLLKIIDEGVIG